MSFFIKSNDDDDENGSTDGEEGEGGFTEGTIYDPSLAPHKRKLLTAESSSVINFYPEWCKCFGSASIKYPHGENTTCRDLIRYFFQCPPHGAFARISSFFIIFGLSWAILYFLIGPVAGFKGPILALIILEISGLFSGMFMKTLGLPSLLAPLVIGIIFRNIEAIDIFKFFKFPYDDIKFCMKHLKLDEALLRGVKNDTATLNENWKKCCRHAAQEAQGHWITPIREIALTMILTRAGLELSPKQLKKLKGVVPALAFLPCVVESLTCSVLFFLIYMDLEPSYAMCLVAGFALAAVSPAVVVPGILSIAKKGYGVAKGIPTLLIASSSIDDVLAISLFTLCLSIATAGNENTSPLCKEIGENGHEEPDVVLQYAGGVIGLCIGVVHGIIFGMVLHFIPSRDMGAKGTLRLLILLSINIASMLGYQRTEFLSSAGSVGVLLTSFVASFGWRSQPHWKPVMHEIEHKLAHIWTLCVPILFGTIGKEMKFAEEEGDDYFNKTMKNSTAYKKLGHPFESLNIAKLFGIIFACLLIRSLTAYFVVSFAGLNVKERIFVAFAWIPKATVQAALAPLVITTVQERNNQDLGIRWLAMNTVAVAVFAILLTAPAGSIAISCLGPRLLSKIDPSEVEDEFPNGEPPPTEEASQLFELSRRESRLPNYPDDGILQETFAPRIDGPSTPNSETAETSDKNVSSH